MSIQTLTPGTLVNNQYPANAQLLLNTFAGALYAPTATREFYSQASSSGLSTGKNTIWYDETKRALKVFDGTWIAPVTGNRVSVTQTYNAEVSNVTLANYSAQFTAVGSNLISLSFTFRGGSNKVLLRGVIPWVTSNTANDILIAHIASSSTTNALGAAYQQVPSANAPVALAVEALFTPGAAAAGSTITFGLRIANSTSGAVVKVGKTGANGNAWNPLTLTAEEIE
jgi:hypothetical protein